MLSENHKVICVDNLLTGKMRNMEAFMGNSKFQFIQHDIIHPLEIEGKVDEIYNMACPASPPKYQKDPIHTLQTNFLGVFHLLELAKQKGARFLQTSTSEVYGEPQISPQSEEYRGNVNMVGIRSCYDEGKRVAETLITDYHHQHGVEVRIVRIFNTYGPKMDLEDGRVVTNFIRQALANEDITLYGNGEQTRSFCYIDDQIEGIVKLMNSDYVFPINIGNPYEITVKELAERVLRLIPTSSQIVYKKLPLDDPTNRRPDITKAKKLLGWEPKYDLDTGLKKTIASVVGTQALCPPSASHLPTS
jgi:UDP-glucuronate decarboxylase